MGILSSFFRIKRAQQQIAKMEIAELEMEYEMVKLERKLTEMESANVRPHVWREFQLEHAMSRMMSNMGIHRKSRTTEEIMRHGRLTAKLLSKQ